MVDADLFPREKASDHIEARCLRRTTDKYMRCHVEEILFAIWARSHFRSTVCIQYPSSSGALYWWGSNYVVKSSCSNYIGQFSPPARLQSSLRSAYKYSTVSPATRNRDFPCLFKMLQLTYFFHQGFLQELGHQRKCIQNKDFLLHGCLFGPFLCTVYRHIKEINVPILPQHHFSDPYSQTTYKATLPDYCY
jgi:hypothetical protein